MRELEPAKMRGENSEEIISFECAVDKSPIETLMKVEHIRRKTVETIPIIMAANTVECLFQAMIMFPFPSAHSEPLINKALRMKSSVLDLILRKAMQRFMEIQKDAPEPN